ncbi:MAG TPA: class I SAM-dependent methyltransferase [Patescibacteria group bacterium]|jgi:SAM-dependent methyltransferase|nr:class I SAM-dependent methyltransferase [Patescibacteria group bacterium]
MRRYTEYDRFAEIYSRHWNGFSARCLPVLDRLLLGELAAGAKILDLCCGAGHMAALLTARGFRVTGLDGSEEMIRRARANAPAAEFIAGDARSFSPQKGSFDAAVCLFDSLNHLMTSRDLADALGNVRAALRTGGRFVFDMNMEEGYLRRWNDSLSIVEDAYVCVVRARFDAAAMVGSNDVTLFERAERWVRSDFTLTQRCYPENEVLAALSVAGFVGSRSFEASRDLQADMGVGRSFFTCVAG